MTTLYLSTWIGISTLGYSFHPLLNSTFISFLFSFLLFQSDFDHEVLEMMASSGNRVMDQSKQTAAAILTNNINQQAGDHNNNNPRAVQRCPRCDSSNTKFCYYNNYSLSQPRHFCKACKRYWTRGGTLRNVPVGGGCRKNKRIKKPNSSSISTAQSHNNRDQIIGISKAAATSTNHHGTSLFYSNLPSNQLSDINNLTIPRSPPSFVFSRETLANNGYDNILQPQFSGLGLNFYSTYLSSSGANTENINGYKDVFNPISTTSNSLLSNFSLFGTTSTTSPTTIVTSSLENQKLSWGTGVKESISIPTSTTHYQDLPFEVGENDSRMVSVKIAESVKIEDGNNKSKLDWNSPFDQNSSLMNDQQNNINIINNGSSDNNSSIFWNSLSVGGGGGTTNWSDDLSHYGSSVPHPLI
ncbi:hypothetical protein MKX01_037324 [Papaver californicum]|nr:hypothetical protein MKX01_037324 [Papaver californicum]